MEMLGRIIARERCNCSVMEGILYSILPITLHFGYILTALVVIEDEINDLNVN